MKCPCRPPFLLEKKTAVACRDGGKEYNRIETAMKYSNKTEYFETQGFFLKGIQMFCFWLFVQGLYQLIWLVCEGIFFTPGNPQIKLPFGFGLGCSY